MIRWIIRNGEKVLQQEERVGWGWYDVPIIEEELEKIEEKGELKDEPEGL